MMCDGASIDEVRFAIHGLIARQGFAITGCEGSVGEAGWSYTIGLTSQFDHPELVIVGIEDTEATRLLHGLCELIKAGDYLDAESAVRFRTGERAYFVDVHPVHFDRGLLNGWLDYMRALGPLCPPPRALQVVLDHEHRCKEHRSAQPLLDSPETAFTSYRPNRSHRRAQPGPRRRPPRGRPRRRR